MSQEHTRKDSEQICKAVCRLPARIAEGVYQVSPSRVCTTRQSVQQAVKLPVRFKQSEEIWFVEGITIRELGKTFQLSRRPSRSSTSDHCATRQSCAPERDFGALTCSLRASISMISGGRGATLATEYFKVENLLEGCRTYVVGYGAKGPER